jgi:hypothetical protein
LLDFDLYLFINIKILMILHLKSLIMILSLIYYFIHSNQKSKNN